MNALLIYAVMLLVAVLVSSLANRSILSVSALFLLAGFVFEEEVLGYIQVRPTDALVSRLAELALFAVLFTDGMRLGLRELTGAWRLPGRALLLGMPLTMGITAVLAHWLVGLGWLESLLLGAALSPTDPVFAAAIVGREGVPLRLRRLLNVESGLNDGLALPFVVVMLELVGHGEPEYLRLIGEVAGGVALGVAIPYVALKLEESRLFKAAPEYEPLNAFAIGLLVLAVAWVTHANEYLAAFAAGVTIATMSPQVRERFHEFGEMVAELLKLAALLLFGALISPQFLSEISGRGYAFAALALLAVRPIALTIALFASELNFRERAAAAWFGPRGFASVVYGLLIVKSEVSVGERLFHLIAVVVAASILAHSSTDVVLAKWLSTGGEEREDTKSGSQQQPAPERGPDLEHG